MATSNSTPETVTRQVGKMTLTLPSEREVVLRREFDAPRRLVWEAHTKAEHIPRWWGPAKYTTTIVQMDVRPGGAWRFTQVGPDGVEHGFRGEYREIVPIERIVQTFAYDGAPGQVAVETLTFEERGGKTILTSTAVFPSREARDGMVQSGMEEGAAEGYDRLEALVVTLSS
jgi:uncharacterized protein YndB with AHSA1/START domain